MKKGDREVCSFNKRQKKCQQTQKCEERNINRIFGLREKQQNIFLTDRESRRRILIIIYYDRKKNFCITYEMCLEIEEYNKEIKFAKRFPRLELYEGTSK